MSIRPVATWAEPRQLPPQTAVTLALASCRIFARSAEVPRSGFPAAIQAPVRSAQSRTRMALPLQVVGSPARSKKKLLAGGRKLHHSKNWVAGPGKGDQCPVERQSTGELLCAVDLVNDPELVSRRVLVLELLIDEAMDGIAFGDPLSQSGLDRPVDGGDRAAVVLDFASRLLRRQLCTIPRLTSAS